MKMSSKARYGLYIAVELAKNYDGECVVPVSNLAHNTGVTEKYVEQIISLMKKGGIVSATRGFGGGYTLTDLPQNISVGKVLRAVEDNLEIVDCIHGTCDGKCNCVSHNLWNKLYLNINTYLDTINLQQLIDDEI